jgi:hypothetical protein
MKCKMMITGLVLCILGSMAVSAQECVDKKLTIDAKLMEIRGKYPPNDLYDYVFIFKYQIVKVIEGDYEDGTILVGHFNPRIARDKIEGDAAELVLGNVKRFKKGDVHRMELVLPMEAVWDNAVIDEYFDDDDESERWFCVRCDKAR